MIIVNAKLICLSNKIDFVGVGLSQWRQVGHHCSLSPGERTLWRLTPFGSARLGSPTHSRSRFALTHLPLPCHPTLRPPRVAPFYINPRLVPASSPLSTGKWEWTLVQRWIDPLCNLRLTPRSPSRFHDRSFLPFHPRCSSIPVTADDDDDFSARRRTLIPISKIRLPSKPRIDWQKQRQRAPPKATPPLSLFFSATDHPWNFKEDAEDRQFRFLELRIHHDTSSLLNSGAFSTRSYFFY